MNQSKLQSFRKRLMSEFDELTKEIREHSEPSELVDSEVSSAVVSSEDRLRDKIELALRRIGDGTYGECMQCGIEISEARLEAKPSVALCTSCQEAKEKEQAQP